MTTSRKERKRKVGKLVEKIQEVVDAGDYEKPLEDESGIKMERVGTAAGKSVNIARVSLFPVVLVEGESDMQT